MVSFSLNLPEHLKNPLVFYPYQLATQANGSIKVVFDETVVLVTACMSSQPKEEANFLPLIVEYQEKTYAKGKIPGGFIKREGRPKDSEILCARIIDRPLRPFFPNGFINEVQIVAMVLSSDGKNDPDVLAINGASCALLISDIPFFTPIGAVRVGKINNRFIINPTYEERENAVFEVIVAGTQEKVVMLEAKANEAREEDILEAIKFSQRVIQEIVKTQISIREKSGKKKVVVPLCQINEDILKKIEERVSTRLESIYSLTSKEEREKVISDIVKELEILFEDKEEVTSELIKEAFFQIEKKYVRKRILRDGIRPDSRRVDEVRPIDCKVRVLPRTHGSALFTRGQTQSLSVVTLGTSADEQMIEALEGEKSKHFMLHYSFPPFSVGEVRPLRGPSRREIGHGALAERALSPIIPEREEFPYTIRVVSEILESNGSSSMATVCAASLSLMDAGVPIKEQVAGIALGLISEKNEYKILTDIAGVEDHYGDMDFKVAGTKKGITAIQLDVKIDGLDVDVIREALEQAKSTRVYILEKMNKALSLPREGVSKYAPKIKSFKIDLDKIGDVIGPGGRVIRKITREHNVTIDIDDETGRVSVVAETEEDLNKAVEEIAILTKDISIGEVYNAKVVRITNFGAFCELAPSKIGLLHISEVSDKFVKDIKDFLKEGDIVKVKVINVDPNGKITLSKKQAE